MNMKLANGMYLKITELYAFISKDTKGHEGIMGGTIDGVLVPFIGADLERLEQLRIIADDLCKQHNIHYEIRYFSCPSQMSSRG